MPELPEVETIKSCLEKEIVNLKITKAEIFITKNFKFPNDFSFGKDLINQSILHIHRIAKYLIFELENYLIINHLRMEGKMIIFDIDEIDEKIKNHMIFKLNFQNNKVLIFQDFRKFATVVIVKKIPNQQIKNYEEFKFIGKEPFEIELNEFYDLYKKSKGVIKTQLLNQKKISGIGNIYVDEILFASKIHPQTNANKITKNQYEEILINAKKILKKAIDHNGATTSTYRFCGKSGDYQKFIEVYRRKKTQSGLDVIKIIVNGRGTYYCPDIQKL